MAIFFLHTRKPLLSPCAQAHRDCPFSTRETLHHQAIRQARQATR